ncbi:MAG: response regulator [Haloarculaceae archaeon]
MVDDDAACRQLHELWLADSFSVRTAGDGATALSELDGSVAVVVLDREMSGLSGADVFDRIRQAAHDPAIVVVSGLRPDGSIDADAYLQKPIRRDDLVETVHELVRNERPPLAGGGRDRRVGQSNR